MGAKLLEYYKYIKDEMGFTGQIKLAQITKIPSTLAALAPDDKITLGLFDNALEKLTGKKSPFKEE